MISRNKQVSIPSRKEMSGFIKTRAKVSTVTHRSKYSDSWQKKSTQQETELVDGHLIALP